MFKKKDDKEKDPAAEAAAKDKAEKEDAKRLAKENDELKKKLEKSEGKNAKATEKISQLTKEAAAADKSDEGDDGKPKDQASQVVTPVPQGKDDGKPKPELVVVGKTDKGERFYGEDFGEGLVDRYTGKKLFLGSAEKTIKVVDPKNPNVMRPKKIIVPVYKLK